MAPKLRKCKWAETGWTIVGGASTWTTNETWICTLLHKPLFVLEWWHISNHTDGSLRGRPSGDWQESLRRISIFHWHEGTRLKASWSDQVSWAFAWDIIESLGDYIASTRKFAFWPRRTKTLHKYGYQNCLWCWLKLHSSSSSSQLLIIVVSLPWRGN